METVIKNSKVRIIFEVIIGIIIISTVIFPLIFKETEETYQNLSYISGTLLKGNYRLVNHRDGSPAIIDDYVVLSEDVNLIIPKNVTVNIIPTTHLPSKLPSRVSKYQLIYNMGGTLRWEGKIQIDYDKMTFENVKKFDKLELFLSDDDIDDDNKQLIDIDVDMSHLFKDYCGNCIQIDGKHVSNHTLLFKTNMVECERKYFTFTANVKTNQLTLVNGACAWDLFKDVSIYKADNDGNQEKLKFYLADLDISKNIILKSEDLFKPTLKQYSYLVYYKNEPIYHNDLHSMKFGENIDVFYGNIVLKTKGNIIEDEKHVIAYGQLDTYKVDINIKFTQLFMDNVFLLDDINISLLIDDQIIDYEIHNNVLTGILENIEIEKTYQIELICQTLDGFDCGYFQRKIEFVKGDVFTGNIMLKAKGNIIEDEKHVIPYGQLDTYKLHISLEFTQLFIDNIFLLEDINISLLIDDQTIDYKIDDNVLIGILENIEIAKTYQIELICQTLDGFDCGYFERKIEFIEGVDISIVYHKSLFNFDGILKHNNILIANNPYIFEIFLGTENQPRNKRTWPLYSIVDDQFKLSFKFNLPHIYTPDYNYIYIYQENYLVGKVFLDLESYYKNINALLYDNFYLVLLDKNMEELIIRYQIPYGSNSSEFPDIVDISVKINTNEVIPVNLRNNFPEHIILLETIKQVEITDLNDNIIYIYNEDM